MDTLSGKCLLNSIWCMVTEAKRRSLSGDEIARLGAALRFLEESTSEEDGTRDMANLLSFSVHSLGITGNHPGRAERFHRPLRQIKELQRMLDSGRATSRAVDARQLRKGLAKRQKARVGSTA